MPVPSPRNSIRIARGNYADLAANATEIGEGELCFAIDQDKFYSKSNGALVAVGGGTALYSIAQLGDVDPSGVVDGQVLVYSSSEGKWIPADQTGGGGGGAVDSVNGQTGEVVLVVSDLTNDAGYITAAEAPVQVSDIPTNNNQLLNGAGYITSAEAPVQPGDVFSGDYSDLSNKPSIPSDLDDLADVNAASPSDGQFLQWNGSEWVPGAASGAPVDSVNGKTGEVVLVVSDLANDAGYITAADVPPPYDDSALDARVSANEQTIAAINNDYTTTDEFNTLNGRVTTNEHDIEQLQTDVGNINTFSGDYNDLTNKPDIPVNVSELNNDAGYLTTETVNNIDLSALPTLP